MRYYLFLVAYIFLLDLLGVLGLLGGREVLSVAAWLICGAALIGFLLSVFLGVVGTP